MIELYERRSRRHAHEYFPTLPLAMPYRYTRGGLEYDRDRARLFANSMVMKQQEDARPRQSTFGDERHGSAKVRTSRSGEVTLIERPVGDDP